VCLRFRKKFVRKLDVAKMLLGKVMFDITKEYSSITEIKAKPVGTVDESIANEVAADGKHILGKLGFESNDKDEGYNCYKSTRINNSAVKKSNNPVKTTSSSVSRRRVTVTIRQKSI